MADTIFVSGNYLIADNASSHYTFPLSDTYYTYSKVHEVFSIISLRTKQFLVISKADITKWENDSSIAYNESTFTTLLRKNTGLKTII